MFARAQKRDLSASYPERTAAPLHQAFDIGFAFAPPAVSRLFT